MCLAVPGKVLEIVGDDPLLRAAKVSFAGVVKLISLTCTPEAQVGDFVLVHVGVAISTVDPKEAEETFRYLQQMGELDGLEIPPETSVAENAGLSLVDMPLHALSGTATSAGPTKQEATP